MQDKLGKPSQKNWYEKKTDKITNDAKAEIKRRSPELNREGKEKKADGTNSRTSFAGTSREAIRRGRSPTRKGQSRSRSRSRSRER